MQSCSSLSILWHCLSLGFPYCFEFKAENGNKEFMIWATVSSRSWANAQNSPSQASAIHELWIPDVHSGFRKGRGTRDQIANICWIMEKAKEFQKNLYFFIDCAKAFNYGSQQTGKFWKRWEYQTTWPSSWETYMQVRKQQWELDMEQQTGFNRKRSTSRLYIVTLLI